MGYVRWANPYELSDRDYGKMDYPNIQNKRGADEEWTHLFSLEHVIDLCI